MSCGAVGVHAAASGLFLRSSGSDRITDMGPGDHVHGYHDGVLAALFGGLSELHLALTDRGLR